MEPLFGGTDRAGAFTLSTLEPARRYTAWMYEAIRPYCRGEMLELGSGTGNISRHLLEAGHSLLLSDYQAAYCQYLSDTFGGGQHPGFRGVRRIDLADPAFDRKYGKLFGMFDTVFTLNVVEHIRDDEQAVRNAGKFLREDGTLIILVPALPGLYNTLDRYLNHYRRYLPLQLVRLFGKSGMRVRHWQYFNAVGVAAWIYTGSIRRKKLLPPGSVRLFDRFVPLFRCMDPCFRKVVGLSLIIVGQKNKRMNQPGA
jgi:SAM-dependent methyltransferase